MHSLRRWTMLFETALLPDPFHDPAFKAWFGSSKVVDKAGQPLVVYHGAGKAFETFRTPSYFTYDPAEASAYAVDRGHRGGAANVAAVYLRIERPAGSDDLVSVIAELGLDPDQSANVAALAEDPAVVKRLRARGFDGVKDVLDFGFRDDFTEIAVLMVFDPDQIRWALSPGG